MSRRERLANQYHLRGRIGREVCEKEKEDERAAGVVVFSGVIQVSESARNCSDRREA